MQSWRAHPIVAAPVRCPGVARVRDPPAVVLHPHANVDAIPTAPLPGREGANPRAAVDPRGGPVTPNGDGLPPVPVQRVGRHLLAGAGVERHAHDAADAGAHAVAGAVRRDGRSGSGWYRRGRDWRNSLPAGRGLSGFVTSRRPWTSEPTIVRRGAVGDVLLVGREAIDGECGGEKRDDTLVERQPWRRGLQVVPSSPPAAKMTRGQEDGEKSLRRRGPRRRASSSVSQRCLRVVGFCMLCALLRRPARSGPGLPCARPASHSTPDYPQACAAPRRTPSTPRLRGRQVSGRPQARRTPRVPVRVRSMR